MDATDPNDHWFLCNQHLPVEVLFWVDNEDIKDTLMYVSYNGRRYSLYWDDNVDLSLYSHGNAELIRRLKNIPMINPEQAPVLLKRLLNNLAFT